MSCCYNTKFISFSPFSQLANFCCLVSSTNEKHVAGVSLSLCQESFVGKAQDVCCLGAVDTFVSCTINYFYQLTPQPEQDKASPKLNSFMLLLKMFHLL